MVHAEQPEDVRQFNAAVNEKLQALNEELRPAATVTVMDDDPRGTTWSLDPANRDAVQLTVDSSGWESVMVTIGDFALLELGWQADATPTRVLADLDEICRSVASGRLTLRMKRGSKAVKYRLILSDGEPLEGSRSWLLPVMPWTKVDEVRPAPYR